MRNKDTGEFELVVGNKELLSAFFIGVVLLSVVFALGYVLGRGTPRSPNVATDTAGVTSASPERPQPIPPTVAASPEPVAATPPAQTDSAAAAPPVEPQPQPTTVPARENPPAAAPPAAAPPPAAEPGNASYWQVLAGSPTSAQALSQTLRGRGFPTLTRPGPNSLTLVWVGPYTDKESLSRAKKQLEDAGITNLYKKP